MSPKSFQPSKSSKVWVRRFCWCFCSLCLLFVLYWVVVAVAVSTFAPGALNRDLSGNRVQLDGAHVGGFPLNFDTNLSGLEVAALDIGLVWQPPKGAFAFSIPAYAPWRIQSDLSGIHTLSLVGQSGLDSQINAEKAHFSVNLSTGRIPNKLEAEAELISGQLFDLMLINAENASLSFVRPGERSELNAKANTISLPPELVPLVGAFLHKVDIKGFAEPALPTDPNRISMQAWQSQDNRLVLQRFTAEFEELSFAARGELRLNADLEPRGQLDLEIQGIEAVLNSLVQLGALPERQARMAGGLMKFMQRPNAQGIPTLSIPLLLSDRGVAAGPLQLDWKTVELLLKR